MLQHVTSYSNSSGTGTPVNDVLMVYNSFSQLTGEYQAHGGSASAGGAGVSPAVQYSYASGTANTIRLTGVLYPSGSRTIAYGYNSGTDDNLSRLSYLSDTGGTLSEFSYLGLGRIVTESYPQPGVTLDYSGGTAATYAGLDNFGRVAQQPWQIAGGTAALDQFNYSYDLAGNRLTRQNVAGALKDEQYTYDGVYRVYASSRGSLTTSGTISGTPVRQEAWGLDATGNWSTYSQSNSGTLALSQTRSHNTANQLQNIVVTGGTTSLTYDKAGNTLTLPEPSNSTLTLSCTYDAWNRLMATSDGTTAVGFAYDGLGRRISKSTAATATHYYLAGQQVVETRNGSPASSPDSLAPSYQYIWSPRYVDAPVLRDDFTASPTYPRLYYLNDANMNVASVVSTSGAVVERYVYDAYGTPTFYDSTWTTSSTTSVVGNASPLQRPRTRPGNGPLLLPRPVLQPRLGEVYRQGSGWVHGWNECL